MTCSQRVGFLGRQKLRLPDDDPDMMLVLLSAAHARYYAIPRQLEYDQLLKMARICHSYDSNEVVGPFIEGWVQPYKGKLLKPGYERWLFIAYQFGMEADYLTLARHLAVRCRIRDDKQLIAPGPGERVLRVGFPKGSLGKLSKNGV
jgi:hypothetical protein